MSSKKDDLEKTVIAIGNILQKRGLMLVTAESCTGGLVAEIITSVPNCSSYFERGFVTYSNISKVEMLGVSKKTLDDYGAVSASVAREMAMGAIRNSHAQLSLSITGIAGPSGGTPEKPVGTVFFAWALPDGTTQDKGQHFTGDRNAIRLQSASYSLKELLRIISVL